MFEPRCTDAHAPIARFLATHALPHGVLQAQGKGARRSPAARLKLLERGAVALYHKSNVLSSDLAWFRQQNYAIHELNATTWATPADFHADAQRALSFPDHYSKNLASWIDCLAEMPVPDESGTLIVFRRYDAFARAQSQLAQTILDSIETTSRRFLIDRPATDRPGAVG